MFGNLKSAWILGGISLFAVSVSSAAMADDANWSGSWTGTGTYSGSAGDEACEGFTVNLTQTDTDLSYSIISTCGGGTYVSDAIGFTIDAGKLSQDGTEVGTIDATTIAFTATADGYGDTLEATITRDGNHATYADHFSDSYGDPIDGFSADVDWSASRAAPLACTRATAPAMARMHRLF